MARFVMSLKLDFTAPGDDEAVGLGRDILSQVHLFGRRYGLEVLEQQLRRSDGSTVTVTCKDG